MSLLCGIAIINGNSISEYNNLRADENRFAQSQLMFKDIRYNIVQIQQFLTDVSATGDREPVVDAEKNMNEAIKTIRDIEEIVPEYKDQLETFIPEIKGLFATGKRMANTYIEKGKAEGNKLMKASNGFDAVSSQLADHADKMSTELAGLVESQKILIQESNEKNNTLSMGSSVLSLLIAVAIFFVLYQRIIGPISTLNTALADLNSGEGDLSRRLARQRDDEFGGIINQFNRFIESIHNIIRQIEKSINPVVNVAQSVARVGEETNQGAKSQAMETSNVATAVTQMSAAVNEVAENASSTMVATRETENKASEGKKVVSETIVSINALATEVNQASDVIKKLEGFSGDIGSVLDVIKGIAEQTNLLALNAAIEAARAGEQGRGFAVVADEVRTLAGRTQNSTEEIQRMIEQLQGAASEAVGVMARGHEKAQASVEKASEAGESLEGITDSVTTIAEMSAQIATSAEEQSKVAEEINQNVVTISQVTDSTVERAENTSKESEKLVGLAKELSQLVSKFNT